MPQLKAYRDGWSALSQLIGRGRSFSGHERNCCFLNLGRDEAGDQSRPGSIASFADVSAISSFDFADDARAVALVDWDRDGRMDMFVSNRTAPRVRFLLNRMKSANASLSLRLVGTLCNRDAIGSRVRVVLQGSTFTRMQTLRAGDGFLSQSTKWLVFGLGQSPEIDFVEVSWPGGATERFDGCAPNGSYRLVQGAGHAQSVEQLNDTSELMTEIHPAGFQKTDAGTRTWIMGRLPLPYATVTAQTGEARDTDQWMGKPTLITLWSRTCLPCLAELNELHEQQPHLEATGLRVAAVCVDDLADSTNQSLACMPRFSGAENSWIEWFAATQSLIDSLQVVQRNFVELQTPIRVPTSFLLDRWGRVVAIYGGRVSPETLKRDMELLSSSAEEQRTQAVPYPGRFASNVFSPDPVRLAQQFEMADRQNQAADYLRRYLDLAEKSQFEPGFWIWGDAKRDISAIVDCHRWLADYRLETKSIDEARVHLEFLLQFSDDADLHRRWGAVCLQLGAAKLAASHLSKALAEWPNDSTLLYNAGLANMAQRNYRVAIALFQRGITHRPDDAEAYYQMAVASQLVLESGDGEVTWEEVLACYRHSLRIRPNWVLPANNLAWLLATLPDPALRDPKTAVTLAEHAVQLTEGSQPEILSTLAVALREAGDLKRASDTNTSAIQQLLKQKRNPALLKKLLRRQAELNSQLENRGG